MGAFDKEYRVRAREHAITERLQPNSFLLIMLCISLKVVWVLNERELELLPNVPSRERQ